MTNHARIQGGIVVELIPPHPSGLPPAERFAEEIVATCIPVPEEQPEVAIGWTYDGEIFAPAAVVPPVEVVPPFVTPAQARATMAALILPDGRSLLTATEDWLAAALAATASLPESHPQRIAARQAEIWWSYGQVVERHHPLLLEFAASIEMEAQQIDALFIQASQRS